LRFWLNRWLNWLNWLGHWLRARFWYWLWFWGRFNFKRGFKWG
jgi:hypothetical protein